MLLARIIFFPFWIIKLVLGVAASIVVYFGGCFVTILGETTLTDVADTVNDIMRWAVKYP